MFHVEHKYLDIKYIITILVVLKTNNADMFRPNDQPELFSFENALGKRQRDLLALSKEKWFYKLVLRNINEHDFKPLFSGKASRPNVGVNVLVSALILKKSSE